MDVNQKKASETPNGSEVTLDLGNELRDLEQLFSSAYFFSLSLKSLFSQENGGAGNKIDL